MFPASFPTHIHQQQDSENGVENSLDDQSASNNTDFNFLDTNATTQNSANNIGISSSGDILTCTQAQDDSIPSTFSSYVSPQTIKPYPKASRQLRGRKNTKKR